jgi:hypothetical protein
MTILTAGALVALVLVAVVFADVLRVLFGSAFNTTSVTTFRLLAVAAIPYLVVSTGVARLRVETRPSRLLLIVVLSGPGSVLAIWPLAQLIGPTSVGWAYLLANSVAMVPAVRMATPYRPPPTGAN